MDGQGNDCAAATWRAVLSRSFFPPVSFAVQKRPHSYSQPLKYRTEGLVVLLICRNTKSKKKKKTVGMINHVYATFMR